MSSLIIKSKKNGPPLKESLLEISGNLEILEIHSGAEEVLELNFPYAIKNLSINMESLKKIAFSSQLFKTLKVLKIRANSYEIDFDLSFLNLETLQISSGLTRIDLSKTPNLKTLNLSQNRLVEVDSKLTKLTRLNLDHNNFKKVPELVWNTPSLLHLSIDENPLTQEEQQKLFDRFKIWF